MTKSASDDNAAVTSNAPAAPPKKPQWPAHNAPRVWFLTDGLSPIGISLSRLLLDHGDYVVAGVLPSEFNSGRGDELREFMLEVARESGVSAAEEERGEDEDEEDMDDGGELEMLEEGRGKKKSGPRPVRKKWRERFKIVAVDGRNVGQCQSAVADALAAFDHIDILVNCRSDALVGTIEELDQTLRTQNLIRDQFETNFFAPVNIIRALLPTMREKRNGHIVAITGITAHLGTPGLPVYCSSQWALEGYCDSLSYEIAPFNIKMTIVQPNMEIPVLTNRITTAPPMPEYAPDANGAPLSRELFAGILDRLDDGSQVAAAEASAGTGATPKTPQDVTSPASVFTSSTPGALPPTGTFSDSTTTNAMPLTQGDLLHASAVTSLFPTLPSSMKHALVLETVFAIAAIGGHDNPPSRHIVGHEGVASVKEKLKTISEELEDFLGVSGAVDIGGGSGGAGMGEYTLVGEG